MDHQLTSVKDSFWKPVQAFTAIDGEWRPMRTFVARNGEWVPTRSKVALAGWPKRDTFTPSKLKPHGRDIWYDQHVAEQPVLPPLRAAQTFLRSYFGA